LPTWVGASLKSGYDANRGDYLSKEMYIPSSGLWYMGVELPIGQGLLFDERRAQLKQAKIAGQLGETERKLIINDLALDAFSSYWLWVEAYRKVSIAKEGVELAKQRLLATKSQVDQGESPSIDTVEALMQLESRSIDLLQAENQFKNTTLLTELYLWTDSLQPLSLNSNLIPQEAIDRESDATLNSVVEIDSLPIFQQVKYKVEQLDVELKWKREQLKPTLNLGYNLLTQPIGNSNFQPLSTNNYKFGMTAYVPLLLRKERASFKQAKLKLENASIDVSTKKRDYEIKIQTLKSKRNIDTIIVWESDWMNNKKETEKNLNNIIISKH
jgi:outer membrane protein TolC